MSGDLCGFISDGEYEVKEGDKCACDGLFVDLAVPDMDIDDEEMEEKMMREYIQSKSKKVIVRDSDEPVHHLVQELDADESLVLRDTLDKDDYIVFGRGNPNAKVMIIAEAPGETEAKKGLPLVGPSGELVNELFNDHGFDTDSDCYVTNIVRIFPHNKRKGFYGGTRRFPRQPTASEIKSHVPHLKKLIEHIKPRVIYCLGRIAANVLCADLVVERLMEGDELSLLRPIGELQKQVQVAFIGDLEYGTYIVPMWHPSYILRSESKEQKKTRMSIWTNAFSQSLEYWEKSLVQKPYPMVLNEAQDGWNRETHPDFEWSTPDRVFWERPPVPDLQELCNKELVFEVTALDYLSKENKFRGFGRTVEGHSVQCTIEGFGFHFFTSIPERYASLPHNEQMLSKIRKDLLKDIDIPFSVFLEKHDSLYGYRSKFVDMPYFLRFNVERYYQIRVLLNKVRELWGKIVEYTEDEAGNKITLRKARTLLNYESDVPPECRFTYDTNIKACSWVEIPTGQYSITGLRGHQSLEERRTSECDIEAEVHFHSLISHDPRTDAWCHHAPQRIVALDIECLNERLSFPKPDTNPVINVTLQLQVQDDDLVVNPATGEASDNHEITFTLRKCSPLQGTGEGKHDLYEFNDERKMLCALRNCLLQIDPDIIAGHNIKKFDMTYLIRRAEYLRLTQADGWGHLGRVKGIPPNVKKTKFSSRAFGERIIFEVPTAGRCILDTMEIYLREKKLSSYTLDYIASKFLKMTKNNMPYVAIPGFFWGSPDDNRDLNEYCRRDAALVMQLLNFGKWLYGLWEFSRINGSVFPDGIYTRGQQIKVYSCIMHENHESGRRFILPTHDRISTLKEVIVESYMQESDSNQDESDEDDDDEILHQAADKTRPKKTGQLTLFDSFKSTDKTFCKKLGTLRREKCKPGEAKKVAASTLRKARYKGATVIDPVKGFHIRPVLCGDYKSLYPSIHIRFNISHECKVFECQLRKLGFDIDDPERDLYCSPELFKHKGCSICGEKDVHVYFTKQEYLLTVYESDIHRIQWFKGDAKKELIDTGRRELHPYRWKGHEFADDAEREAAKEKIFRFKDTRYGMGLIARALVNLLNARKLAKKMRDKYEPGSAQYSIYDGRQLALKIMANSIYGATGVSVGRIADNHLGASVTAWGRVSIEGTRDRSLEYYSKGVWAELTGGDTSKTMCVGGDTDSWFGQFAFIDNVEQAMEFGPRYCAYQNRFFELPMELDFEKAMCPMLVIAKKRYACNLFAGEFNDFIFEKKRWIELYIDESEWETIFSTPNWYKKPPPGVSNPDANANKEWWSRLGPEADRRLKQSDEEWIADFLRPRYKGVAFNTPDYGRLFARGIETVRRDAPPILSETMQTCLQMIMRENRVNDALMYARDQIRALREDHILYVKLVMSKQISKEQYETRTLPHTYLQKKMLDRGDEAPSLGDRVPFLILSGRNKVYVLNPRTGKKQFMKEEKMYMRAEHPDYVYKHDLQIDSEYYVNLCQKPLLRLFDPIVKDANKVLFTSNKSTKAYVTLRPRQEISDILRYATRINQCPVCDQKHTSKDIICPNCLNSSHASKLREFKDIQQRQLVDKRKRYEEQMDICRKCTNTQSAPCNSFMCQHYGPRRQSEAELSKMQTQVKDIEDLVAPHVSLMKRKSIDSNQCNIAKVRRICAS